MKIDLQNDKMIITWNDENSSTFHYVWLRDNAPENRHANGQKLTESREVDIQIVPESAVIKNNVLVVNWGDCIIEYPEAYLQKFADSKKEEKVLWNTLQEYPVFDYNEATSNEGVLYECLKNVRKYGFTYLNNVPCEEGKILNIVELFGYVIETNYGKFYDVIAKKDPENLADTQLGLPPHTDNPYRNPTPTIQLLHCLKSGVTGGETILVDGFQVASELQKNHPEYFEVLTSYAMNFEFKSKDHWLKNSSPLIQLDANGEIEKVKFNNRSIQPFNLPEDVMLPYYEAYQYFENQLQDEKNHLKFKLEPSQVIIYDNERILHGRTSYNLIGERHLQGCYASRDALYSKINVLENTYCDS